MAKLQWDQLGQKEYETGVDHGVLYPQKDGAYPKGVAWNGLISVTETPSGAEDNALYADNIKYINIKSAEDFGGTIECYYFPKEWAECNGEKDIAAGVTFGQQSRNTFGLSYRTKMGNDTDGQNHGYKLHIIYGASSMPSERAYESENDSPSAVTFSYEFSTTPIPTTITDSNGSTLKPVALITIDSTKVDKAKLAAIEAILYGTEEAEPRLPLPDEIAGVLAEG